MDYIECHHRTPLHVTGQTRTRRLTLPSSVLTVTGWSIAPSNGSLPVSSVSWTVADYLAYWLRHVVREDRRPKTYQGYESEVRLHLIPGLGRKQLAKLTARDVRTFITRTRSRAAWRSCRFCLLL